MGWIHRNYLAFSRWNITKTKEIYKLNHEFLYWAAYMIDRKVEVARLEKNNNFNVKFICSNHIFSR
jgi:hypothetical protein